MSAITITIYIQRMFHEIGSTARRGTERGDVLLSRQELVVDIFLLISFSL